ncbi:MAG: hypothetical protein IT437_09800 [Phycisphaerales bacterium]|nr:hypothetical protein [Phycisphaerales bacterium]
MTVLVIIVTFAAIAVPRYAGSLVRYRVDSAARRVAADLAYARAAARSASSPRTVTFAVASDRYGIAGVTAAGHRSGAYSINLGDEPYRASLTSADFGGDPSVVFSGYGVPDSGGTVVVKGGAVTRTITLSAATGTVTITDGP